MRRIRLEFVVNSRCTGDGINALRSVNMYDEEKKVPEQLREAWKVARANNDRTFSVVNGCWTCNCPFSKEKDGKPSPCKPSADLKFQLSRTIRVGGTAFFHTSGYRSIVQIFSAVERIKELTGGRIAGVPLKLVLRSYKTNHAGQPALQSGVSLEFRAEDFESVRKNLIEQAYKFKVAAGLPGADPVKLIASGDFEEESPMMSAQAMASEFYVDNEDEGDTTTVTTNSPVTAQRSAEKTAEIGEKLATDLKKIDDHTAAASLFGQPLPTSSPSFAPGQSPLEIPRRDAEAVLRDGATGRDRQGGV